MALFFLIRHAENDYVGRRLAGWSPDVHLNEEGRAQAGRLADRLANTGISVLYSSPLERALETAAPLAERLGLEVQIRDALGEIRFGEWTGHYIEDLRQDPLWQHYNAFRSSTRAPGGESMLDVQLRIVTEIESLRRQHTDGTIAIVSHGDAIRAAVLHYAGIPLDLMHRIEISTASVSVISVEDHGPQVLGLNCAP
ncbi:MAG: histidine phosphatase family protein [Acidobacteria bacterium]|nr:histidine phosphatase family protein [Acidobacteriota bacterium]